MGLDMYAYVSQKAGQQNEYYEGAEFDPESKDYVNKQVSKPRELAYWRKHPNLHGWMEQLWRNKKYSVQSTDASTAPNADSDVFNGIELELTWEDLDELERTVTHKQLPSTSGFFFGDEKDEHYYDSDLAFIRNAKAELFLGLKVFYNSSW
jgi:hypothetical protein